MHRHRWTKAEVCSSFYHHKYFWTNVPGHTTREPQVGFELATNSIQLYAIAKLDKTSLQCASNCCILGKSSDKFFYSRSDLWYAREAKAQLC